MDTGDEAVPRLRGGKLSTGPVRSLASRTWMAAGRRRTSTQDPLLLLRVLYARLRQEKTKTYSLLVVQSVQGALNS